MEGIDFDALPEYVEGFNLYYEGGAVNYDYGNIPKTYDRYLPETIKMAIYNAGQGAAGYTDGGAEASGPEIREEIWPEKQIDDTGALGYTLGDTGNGTEAGIHEGASGAKSEITWNKNINATQEVIQGTNIPKSFTIKGMKVNGNEVWVHGNATKHMGEFVKLAKDSIMVENELLLSFQDSLTKVLPKVQPGRNFFNIDGWEIGINGDTGVIYHALHK